MSITAIILWAFLLGMVAFLFINSLVQKKKYKGVDMPVDTAWYENSLAKYPDDKETHQYYFHHDKKFLSHGHVMEDIDHKVVYEAKFLYNNFAGTDEVDFCNHIIDYTHHHKIGKTRTTDVGVNTFSTTLDSTFKFDGMDVYSYLEGKGYSYKFHIKGLAYWIDIKKGGKKVATLYSSNNGKNLYNATGPIVPKMGGAGVVIVETDYKNLDAAFLYAVAFGRTQLSNRNLAD